MWSSLFIVSAAQAIFTLVVLLSKNEKRNPGLYLVISILALILITNIDFYSVSSGLYKYAPHLFGISMGFMFLFGPLLFFYSETISRPTSKWSWKHGLHFSPYLLHVLLNLPFYATSGKIKVHFIDQFVQYGILLRTLDEFMLIIQTTHLSIYLFISMKSILPVVAHWEGWFISPLSKKGNWIRSLCMCFATYWLCVLCLLLYTLKNGLLVPHANYTNTLVTSAILYYIAYSIIVNPEILQNDFSRKSRDVKAWDDGQVNEWVGNLSMLMEQRKLFRNPELKLESLASELKMHPHQLSRLLNEKLQKSFTDYINEYRINDFIEKLGDRKFNHYSVFGLAIESGFKSKSTFNSFFKKHTGKTPTEYRKAI